MLELKNIEPRDYQLEIFETSKENNTIVVLPTGTGKTLNALLLSLYRLNKIKDSKVLIVAPTKPLCEQHKKTYIENTNIGKENISLLTGLVKPKERESLYKNSNLIIATPQTVKEDLSKNIISLKNFSALIIDEAHRAVGNYAYTFLTKKYTEDSEFPRILALTASPGGNKQKINEICDNLLIDAVEIRTEEDIKEHIQEKNIRWLNVDLPTSLKEINLLLKNVYKQKLQDLKKVGFTKPLSIISKKDLIILQNTFRKQLFRKNPSTFYGLSLTAFLIKLDYASELLETQGLKPLSNFFEKLETDTSKAAKNILNFKEVQKAITLTKKLNEKDVKHPKLYMLKGLIRKELQENPKARIITFANYRATIDEIIEFLNEEDNIHAVKLVGQKSGITQKKQVETIKRFEEGIYNVICTTSVGEEGLDISGGTVAIMYDQGSSSEIRKIQRAGRVARVKSGKIIVLLTNNTREIGYYWIAKRKEKTMKSTLLKLQEK
tara:strand:- start:703 stop:2181 length:1479 start_codon:yes stop_codon:yes gene_type:complete